jgi:hypothetical protein
MLAMAGKITGKVFLASLLFIFGAQVCAADTASRILSAKQFAEDVQRSLPFAVLAPLAWSDSYIGQLVSRKPHFGAGVSYGMVMTDFSAMNSLLDDFGATAHMDTGGIMPPVYGHIRLGGFFVPFDIGVIVSIPLSTKPADGFTLERQTVGGDIRFALIREEIKGPGVSLGIAFAQTTGYLLTKVSGSDIGIHWSGSALEIKVHVSKTLRVFTPYIGGGGSFTWSQAGYEATGAVEEEWGMGTGNFANGVMFRVFGGTSVKLGIFRLDFNMNFSIPHLEYGVVTGARFQL